MKPLAGSGKKGLIDGDPKKSTFRKVRGIAVIPSLEFCFVANRYCIRKITLSCLPLSAVPTLSISSSTPSSFPIPTRSIIKITDLSNLEKVGEGAQGIVYRAEWQGNTVIYKQMKLAKNNEERKDFIREFNVWQYVVLFLLLYRNLYF